MIDNQKSVISVIGNGCAAAECIIALREHGYGGSIYSFTNSEWPIYNPMLTTYYVSGKISFEQLFPYGSGDEFCKKYRVESHPGSPVTTLDTSRKTITNKAGVEHKYDQCLVASGASPFVPPIEGKDSKHVYLMRTVEDALRLKQALGNKPKKALVIGASMVGIKLVELFYRAGMQVCLADMADRIFPLTAHADCSQVIEKRLADMGIKMRFGAGIQKIEDRGSGISAYFSNSKETEEADLVAMCIGVVPSTGFINRSQVKLDRGVLVDHNMRTNVIGVYAAGDVAQGNNLLTGKPQLIGLWANARYQGRTAGHCMAGVQEPYPGSIPHNITHFMGMDFVGIGDTCDFDKIDKNTDGTRFTQIFWKNGTITGANFIDTNTEAGIVKNALVKGLLQPKLSYSSKVLSVHNYLINKILSEVKP